MRPRFQADANFNGRIVDGLTRKDPRIDFRTSHSLQLEGLPDGKVLLESAADDRILITHDLKSMPAHFGTFLLRQSSPGVIIVPQNMGIGDAVEALLMVWVASEHEEYLNRIVLLPF